MSLAELKRRLTVGVTVRLVERPSGACDEVKTISLVQSNAIAFGPNGSKRGTQSWIYWARGMRVDTTANGFKVIWPNANFLRYEWMPLTGAADVERESKLDAERVTLEFASKSTRRLDCGVKSIEDSPLFGGERQGKLL